MPLGNASVPAVRARASHDVIVVGAGTAAAAAAMLLARRGLRAVLLRPARPLAVGAGTHVLTRAGVLLLARWGLLDEVAARTPAVRRSTLWFGDEALSMSVKPAFGTDALYAPRRAVLESALVTGALAAGVELHRIAGVGGLMMRDRRVVGVHVGTLDGRVVDLPARLVIGADGIASAVARLAGSRIRLTGEHVVAFAYGYWSGVAVDGFEWAFGPGGRAGVIPTSGGEAWVIAAASPDRIGGGGVAVIGEILSAASRPLGEQLARASAPSTTRIRNGARSFLRTAHGSGWALIGGASGFKDPCSAHGFTDALRDAELLAAAVARGLGNGSDPDDPLDAALDDYEAARDRFAVPIFDVVDRLAAPCLDPGESRRLLQRLSSAMADEVEMLSRLEPEARPARPGS